MKKTNAMRILEAQGIPYDVVQYEWDEEHLDAIHASHEAGLPLEQVFKTIVLKDSDNQVFVFCLPGDFSISMKKVREITGSKSIDLLKLDDLLKTTGYVRGGCSPLGMIHKYPTYIEETAQLEEYVYVSAGQRGLQLKLKPDDLVKAAGAQYADFTME
ncbi:MAG: Cys-tRNA(Pro) deacylase [Sphaerochaeta sp.]|jgi:Cys-tRNA(Pro)/Cys-tRNA(Cys) deacylase|nr:Cys-tRNA(Pro) deacylase [Sphaerochaeta sp.]MCH3918911.1 Cys-tRNA(Pro) deacylase [Sphaerochaeta sp.]MCI2045617.1 Cys-tRNA(Pro) deacylase [Sphaerochaeta sp.]MCI2076884.1 Cys-tRNA(Pro) deacylase [Sphaerochaeta sp.]MCI2097440.1 Cys-tRNA(Pro) deacylase [Sphaerochaeta sp.]